MNHRLASLLKTCLVHNCTKVNSMFILYYVNQTKCDKTINFYEENHCLTPEKSINP